MQGNRNSLLRMCLILNKCPIKNVSTTWSLRYQGITENNWFLKEKYHLGIVFYEETPVEALNFLRCKSLQVHLQECVGHISRCPIYGDYWSRNYLVNIETNVPDNNCHWMTGYSPHDLLNANPHTVYVLQWQQANLD